MAVATIPIYDVKKSERQEDNFSDLIAPSCTSIALLGQLLLLSKKRDFRLVEREKQVKHIKHPESFRACLLQLTHGSWDAFNTAERTMNRVLQNVEGMPSIFDSITEILVDGEKEDVIDLLPAELEAINSRANKCLIYTKQCEEAFEQVMYLIEEISELCEAKDLSLKNEHEEMTTRKLILENHKRQVEEDRKELEKEKARLDAAMKEAQKVYDAAVKDLPGYGTFAMSMINDLVSQALPFGMLFAPMKMGHKVIGLVSSSLSKRNKSAGAVQRGVQDQAPARRYEKLYGNEMDRNLGTLREAAGLMTKWINGDSLQGVSGEEGVQGALEKVRRLKDQKGEIGYLCTTVEDICQRVKDLKGGMGNKEKEAKIIVDINNFNVKVRHVKDSAPVNLDSTPAQQVVDQPKLSAYQTLVETKQKKAELARQHVSEEQTRYDKLRDIRRENTKEMLDVVNSFAKLKVSTLSVAEMRKTLVQGMALFVQIREQWGHLTRYFQFLADVVSEKMNTEVKDFARLADDLKGKNMSKLKQKSLQRISDQAKQSIAETQQLAGLYVDISQKYLMPNLNYVFEIEATSSQRSETDTERALENVRATCKNTIDKITDLADQRPGVKMLKGK